MKSSPLQQDAVAEAWTTDFLVLGHALYHWAKCNFANFLITKSGCTNLFYQLYQFILGSLIAPFANFPCNYFLEDCMNSFVLEDGQLLRSQGKSVIWQKINVIFFIWTRCCNLYHRGKSTLLTALILHLDSISLINSFDLWYIGMGAPYLTSWYMMAIKYS